MKRLHISNKSKYAKTKSQKEPKEIRIDHFNSNRLYITDGSSIEANCLNCLNHPCVKYEKDEITPSVLPGMPHDTNRNVCPTNALEVNQEGFPFVLTDKCIGCGICLTRCNYGAIILNSDFKAEVKHTISSKFDWVDEFTVEEQNLRESQFLRVQKTVIVNRIPEDFFTSLYKNITSLCRGNPAMENLIVRNLLIAIGLKITARPIGNNEVRFDLIGSHGEKVFVGEVGLFAMDFLEGPRAILDDIAVVVSRDQLAKKHIIPFLVTLALPNKRSDIYEVITDIKKITNTDISTLSFHFLIIVNLFRINLDLVQLLEKSLINKSNRSTIDTAQSFFPNIVDVDPFFGNKFYQAIK